MSEDGAWGAVYRVRCVGDKGDGAQGVGSVGGRVLDGARAQVEAVGAELVGTGEDVAGGAGGRGEDHAVAGGVPAGWRRRQAAADVSGRQAGKEGVILMGEHRCFLCGQGFGRRLRGKVRVFVGDDGLRQAEVCAICLRVVRAEGQVEIERGGETFLVRELVPPLADVPRP